MDSFIFNQNLPNKYPENFPDHISDDTESSPGVLDRDGRVQTLENYLVPGPFFDNFSNYSNSPGYSPVTFSAAASVSGVAPPANNQEDVPGGDLTPAGSALLQSQQWQPTGIVDPGPSQVPLESSNAYLDNLVEFLLIKTAFESIRGLTQDILPRLDDEVSLGSLKTFLQGTFSALDASIQGRLDQIAPTRPVTRDRYRCKFCDTRAGARVYRTLGTFKRHVSHTHRAEHIYLCPFNPCTFNKSTRRDKFGQHLPQTHNFRAWDKKFLDGCRKPCPSPASCDICHAGVSSWKKWFKCVANHCRLPIGAYTATSISLSRRGSGSSGGDGSESGDQQPYGGNGFNGVAPAFGGNHMGGNESIYFNVGQQFGYYHASHSQNKVQAPPGCEPLHGADLPADSHFDSASTTGSETTDSQLSVFRATDLRKHHFGLVSTLEHCPSALDNSRDLTLQQKNSEQSSDHSNRKDIKRILPTPRDRNLQNDSPRDLERSFKVKCKNCDHVLEGCTRCEASKRVVRICHICAGGTRQQIPRRGSLHDSGSQYHVCNLGPGVSASSGKSVAKTSQALLTHPFTMLFRRDGHESGLCTSKSLSHNQSISVFSYTDPEGKALLFTIFKRFNDGLVSIFTGSLPIHADCPPHGYKFGQDIITILHSLETVELSVFPVMLMSKVSSRFHRTLLGNIASPSTPFPGKAGNWPLTRVQRNAATLQAAQKTPRCFRTEIRVQLLEGSPDSTSPNCAEATSLPKKRPHKLQMRLRVIVRLFKLKTTIANAQNAQNAQNTQTEIQRRQMDSSTASEVILDYPDSSEIIFDVPIVETEEPSTLWDSLQSNARFIKNLVSLARKHCQLEAYDLQSFDTLLGDILPRLLDSWNNPVRTITP